MPRVANHRVWVCPDHATGTLGHSFPRHGTPRRGVQTPRLALWCPSRGVLALGGCPRTGGSGVGTPGPVRLGGSSEGVGGGAGGSHTRTAKFHALPHPHVGARAARAVQGQVPTSLYPAPWVPTSLGAQPPGCLLMGVWYLGRD